MECQILDKVLKEIGKGKKVALATVTKIQGTNPGKIGAMMCVFEDGSTFGTVGGGNVEFICTKKAKECLEKGESELFHYDLNIEKEHSGKVCDVKADIFIKVFKPKPKLLIVGGGHIGSQLYKVAKTQNFDIVIFDDRENYCNRERFPEASELYPGNIEEDLKNYPINDNCYIVLVTHGHKFDEVALKAVIDRGARYIGMMGSSNKIKNIKETLINKGISKESLDKIYSPIGIDMGSNIPEEIATGIITEIILVKNGGNLISLRDIKK
ncbi:xanthine and CO dehydrogenase maturation factor, XdhC/CoxF family [Gottschalkia purinilytica]|uniref:Xanthine and CO dehydrogenase maturation factor, XdhC/CoxF family n=1 Tax=Gottschalkia purinilytica TaxID=1503 RepID=A0A0L0W6I4_GOTPU|nr:XdhC/CoxI family protein [Gottschalkia purinilytica]KNF07097.1 xanthine and CO dehydrogenase maturation factor, XdhC/CoxF family [Gottschalkia purinilytica]